MAGNRQGQMIAQYQRKQHKGPGQCQVENENAQVQTQQLAIGEHPGDIGHRHLGISMKAFLHGVGRQEQQHDNTRQRQPAGHPEQTRHADVRGQHRSDDHRQHEGQADGHADGSHHPHSNFLAGQIRGQGHHHRGDGTHALQGPSGHHLLNRLRGSGHGTAGCKQQQPDDDHLLASDTVGKKTERQLEQPLGQAVDTDSQADQQGRGALVLLCI